MKYTFNIEVEDLISLKDGKKYNPTKKELDKIFKGKFKELYDNKKKQLERFDLVYDMENFKYDESLLLSGDEEQIKYMISVIKRNYNLNSSELCEKDILYLEVYNNHSSIKVSNKFSFNAYEYLLNSKYFILNQSEQSLLSSDNKELTIYNILSKISKPFILDNDKINIDKFIKYNIHLDIYRIIDLFENINEKRSFKKLKVIDMNEAIKKYIDLYIDINGQISFDELIKNYLNEYFCRDYQKRDYMMMILNHINKSKYDSIYCSDNYNEINIKQLENALNALSVNNKEDKYYDLIIEYIKYFNSSELAFNIIFKYDFMRNLPEELIKNDKFIEIINLLKDSESFLRSIGYESERNWEKNVHICNIVNNIKKESLKPTNDLSKDEAKIYLFDIINKYYPETEKVIKVLLENS